MNQRVKTGFIMLLTAGTVICSSPFNTFAASKTASKTPVATSTTGTVSRVNPKGAGGIKGYIYVDNGEQTFKSDWKLTKYGKDSKLTYGYNTVLINEDFAWAYHSKREHSAIVSNKRRAFMSSKKKKKKTAKIEVRHKGSYIQYQNTGY